MLPDGIDDATFTAIGFLVEFFLIGWFILLFIGMHEPFENWERRERGKKGYSWDWFFK